MKHISSLILLITICACTIIYSVNCTIPKSSSTLLPIKFSCTEWIAIILILYEATVRTYPTIKNYSIINVVISFLKHISEFLNNKK